MCYSCSNISCGKGGIIMANYGIIRMQKFQMSDVQGIQKHNQRQGKSKTNPDIIESKTHLNFDLVNEEKIKYEQTIKDKISERVQRKTRANSVVLSEFLVTASPDYMQSLSDQEQKKYFTSSLEFVKKQYGAENVLYAVVHQDEANPHMHVGIVPITKDNRLSAKDIFNGKQVMIKLQDNYHEHMVEQGFDLERGESKAETLREHVNVHELKKNTEKELERLQENVKGLVKAVEMSKSVDEIEFEEKKNLIGSFKGSKTVKLASDDFGRIKLLAKNSEVLKTDVKGLKNEIKELKDQNIAFKNQNKQIKKEKQKLINKNIELEKHYQSQNQQLVSENESLKKENKNLKYLINYLQYTLKHLKRLSEEYLKVEVERISEYVGKVRMLALGEVFGDKSVTKEKVMNYVPKDEHKGALKYVDFFKERQESQQKVAEQQTKYEEQQQPMEKEKPLKRDPVRDDFERGR